MLLMGSLAFAAYETQTTQLQAFYLLPSRFWELAAGALLYQFNSQGLVVARTAAQSRWSLLSGLIIMVCGFAFSDEMAFPFPWALLPVLGACLMLVGTTGNYTNGLALQKLLQSEVMIYIGRISYSLYLWHWPVFSLFRWTVGLVQPITIAAALCLTFGLAALSFHLVETPVRTNPFLKRQADWKIVSWGIGVVSVAFICAAAVLKYDNSIGLSQSVTTAACTWNPYQVDGCDNPEIEPPVINASGKQIFILGDSHAGAYTAMLRLAERISGAKVYIRGSAGCGVAVLKKSFSSDDSCGGRSVEWTAKKAKPGDIVLLASLRVPRLSGHFVVFDDKDIGKSISSPVAVEHQRLGFEEAVRIVERFQSLGVHVLFDAPKPVFRAPPYRCSDWFNRSNPICERGFTEQRSFLIQHRKVVMDALQKLQESHGVSVWDPFPVLCDAPTCSAFIGDRPLFADGDHISGYANRLLLPSFLHKLTSIWGQNKSVIKGIKGGSFD